MYSFHFEEGPPVRRGWGGRVYTVSELNREVRELLESALAYLWVEGEVSNLKLHSSGHLYFTLKDEGAEIDAALFGAESRGLAFLPENGQKVLAFGRVTIFERRGRYQLVIRELRPAGIGRLQLEFERLKEHLRAEGLFDEARKRPLPPFPELIGIVTSPEGAAIRDICSIIARRYPLVELLLFPARVQGEGAAAEIARAIAAANEYRRDGRGLDVLIVGRGGGSLEDLWAFNEEIVARAIYGSKVPVVSAVGHEIDFTIADFVADVRAPTPSAAAELVVPDRAEIIARIRERLGKLINAEQSLLQQQEARLESILRSYAFRLTGKRLEEELQALDELGERLGRAIARHLQRCEEQLQSLLGRLEVANPLAVLARGYAIAIDLRSGRVMKAAAEAAVGDRLKVRLHRGELLCRVEEVG
ncbi:MAG: exodeoxyribonuclease VII large subunit [Candidatus Acetothermia bacterium]|jgi:exodeoxyribonuclease VII large subunit|nr:exodeoxyribonuclease VII large subunit [Candidatus Acetothermia bacterium]MDH7505101.1 exodeoxyribonuclease VII large subunit [Candidatus Acetothermia bacterium]